VQNDYSAASLRQRRSFREVADWLGRRQNDDRFSGAARFARLPDDAIDAILEHAAIRRYVANAQIFYKGDPGSSMMAVLRGRVVITAPSLEGKAVILNIINELEIFGEIVRLDGKERTVDATAMTDCELMVVARRSFLLLLERPVMTRALLNVLCERLRRTSEQLEDVLFLDLEARIAKILLRFAEEGGAPQPGARVVLGMSQRELGNLVGASREKVNRQLQAWRRAGIITIEEGTIFIRDPAALLPPNRQRRMSW
jgi:CRP/FNR family transcriptional regulator, cyclic AMP receptor protein